MNFLPLKELFGEFCRKALCSEVSNSDYAHPNGDRELPFQMHVVYRKRWLGVFRFDDLRATRLTGCTRKYDCLSFTLTASLYWLLETRFRERC